VTATVPPQEATSSASVSVPLLRIGDLAIVYGVVVQVKLAAHLVADFLVESNPKVL